MTALSAFDVPVPSVAETTAVEQAAAEWAEAAVYARSGECPDGACPCEGEPYEGDGWAHECARCGRCETRVLDRLDDLAHGLVDAVVLAGLAGQVAECAESLTGAVR